MMGEKSQSYSLALLRKPRRALSPPPSRPSADVSSHPVADCCGGNQRLPSKPTRCWFCPTGSATVWDTLPAAPGQRDEQGGFTITRAKANYGLNCSRQDRGCALWLCSAGPTSACPAPDNPPHAPFEPPFWEGQNKAALSALERAAGSSDPKRHHQSRRGVIERGKVVARRDFTAMPTQALKEPTTAGKAARSPAPARTRSAGLRALPRRKGRKHGGTAKQGKRGGARGVSFSPVDLFLWNLLARQRQPRCYHLCSI